jgi:hypothetical protein
MIANNKTNTRDAFGVAWEIFLNLILKNTKYNSVVSCRVANCLYYVQGKLLA